MKILRRLFKKDVEPSKHNVLKNQLIASFSSMKTDLDNQNRWINYLHQTINNLGNNHKTHTKETKGNISKTHSNVDNLNKWINHLHTNSKQQEERLKQVEKNLNATLEQYNNHVMDLFKLVHTQKETISSSIRNDIKNELLIEMQSHLVEHKSHVRSIKSNMENMENKFAELKKSQIEAKKVGNYVKNKEVSVVKPTKKNLVQKEPVSAVQEVYVQQPLVKQPEPEIVYGNVPLTNHEQKLLNVLFSESDPVSYSQLSNKIGHSVNTVRVNMNLLKKKGLIEENMLPTGVKLFNLNNKERIKKMYNVQHI